MFGDLFYLINIEIVKISTVIYQVIWTTRQAPASRHE